MSMGSFQQMQEIHYCRLDYQSNIYGLAKFAASSEENKLLVASLRGKVMSVSFQKTVPSSREVNFTYIPSDAEIISVDAFNRTNPVGLVVAIAFMKVNNYLNIYSDFDTGGELDLDRIALGCQSLDLNFVPYQLYHTEVYHEGEVETVFLLSGGDAKVHLFREAKNTHMFVEEQIDEYFPELVDLPGIATRVQCICVGKQRLTAVGCQNGFIVVALVDLTSQVVLSMYQIQHDSPITSVVFFQLTNQYHRRHSGSDIINSPETNRTAVEDASPPQPSSTFAEYHLIVTSALELAVVYASVASRGLMDALILPDSDAYDCVMCALAADTDFDGFSEILLGTYGQELLVYKFQLRSTLPRQSTSRSLLDGASTLSVLSDRECSWDRGGVKTVYDGDFVLSSRRSLPDPILALEQVDMTGDGLGEIIILSLRGLHVLQHDLKAAAELCLQRLPKVMAAANSSFSVASSHIDKERLS